MAHLRQRYLEDSIRKGLGFKGLVGVFGHRQVGKTTLLELISKRYSTLDQASELNKAVDNPDYYLSELARNESDWPVGIDECQLAPSLFPALKEFVRRNKRPGAFLLSGSVRFSSRKAIRESLTGRILGYELLPFSISELENKPLNTLVLELFRHDFRTLNFETKFFKGLAKLPHATRYLTVGGLPGICFVRNERDRFDLMESQLDLMLDRDLRLVCETSLSVQRLRILLQLLAQTQNQPLNYTDLSRKARISTPVLRKILVGFEAIYLLRMIPCEGDETSPVYFLEYQGEAQSISKVQFDDMSNLVRLSYAHLRIPFAYTPGLRPDIFQYRRHGGAYVPLACRIKDRVVGFICMLEDQPSLSAQRSGQSFLKHYKNSKVVYLHPGSLYQALSSDELVLPVEAIF
jgi:hypothetical protein